MTVGPKQLDSWMGDFGRRYTDRNPHSVEAMDALYARNFGLTRSALNEKFLGGLDRSLQVLEVGTNVGTQLQALRALDFDRLFGIEAQAYALRNAKQIHADACYTQANAAQLPFADGAFDLVFTSGVLIHIPPSTIPDVLAEICRVSSRYVWGFEYFAEDLRAIEYRGRDDLMWKADFARLYQQARPDLGLLREERIPYLGQDNVDTMFLLEKG